VNTDAKKKSCFMRGLSTKIQEALVTCYNATYHEIVNVAIASEEKSRLHKESKKKKQVLSSPSCGIKKHQKFIYHPQNHFRPTYHPPQYQARPQTFICPAATQQYPQQPNAPGIRNPSPITHNCPCYNCGKPSHFSKDCPYPRQYNPNYPRAPVPQQQQPQSKNNNLNVQKGKGEKKKTGHVFYTQASAIPEGEPIMMGMFPVANHPTVLLFDSGASHTFINRTFVTKHDIPIMGTQEDFFIQSPGERLCTKEMVRDIPIELGGHIFPTSMIIL
jgi:hypothetical protein